MKLCSLEVAIMESPVECQSHRGTGRTMPPPSIGPVSLVRGKTGRMTLSSALFSSPRNLRPPRRTGTVRLDSALRAAQPYGSTDGIYDLRVMASSPHD